MKIKSVTIGIPVHDLNDATAWYKEVFQPEQELKPNDDMVELLVGPVWIQLFEGDLTRSQEIVRFKVDDLDYEFNRLKEMGKIENHRLEVDNEIIKYLNFSDPDGNLLCLYRLYTET